MDDGIVFLCKRCKEIAVFHQIGGGGFRGLSAILDVGEHIGGVDGDAVQIAFAAHQDVHGHERDVPLPQQRFGEVAGAVGRNFDLQKSVSSFHAGHSRSKISSITISQKSQNR